MKRSDNLQSSAVILLISTAIVKLIGALFKIPLSSSYGLGDLGFGYFSAAYDFITPINTLALSGFPVAVAKIIADNSNGSAEAVFQKSKSLLLKLSIPVVIAAAVVIIPLSYFSANSVDGVYAYCTVLPSVVLCFAVSAYRGYFEGKEQMILPAISNVIEAFGKLFLGLLFAVIATRVTGNVAIGAAFAILGIAIGTFASLLFLHFSSKKALFALPAENKNDKEFSKYFISIAVPVAIAALAPSLVSFIDSLTVRAQISFLQEDYIKFFEVHYPAFFLENSDEISEFSTLLYGIRSKAYTLYNLVPTLTTAVGVAAVPTISRLFVAGDKDALKEKIALTAKLAAFISVPAGVAYIFFGRKIACMLFEESATSYLTGNLLAIYGVAAVFIGIALPIGMVLQGIGKHKKVLSNVCIGLIVKLILNLGLTASPKINISGSALATVCFAILLFIFNVADLFKFVGFFKTTLIDLLKILISTAVCITAAILICQLDGSTLMFIFAVFVAVIIYAVLNLLLRTFSKEDFDIIKNRN